MLGVHVHVRVHFLPTSMSMFMPTFIFTLMFMGHEVENFKLFRIFAAVQELPTVSFEIICNFFGRSKMVYN
jgi:hypothetical protein